MIVPLRGEEKAPKTADRKLEFGGENGIDSLRRGRVSRPFA